MDKLVGYTDDQIAKMAPAVFTRERGPKTSILFGVASTIDVINDFRDNGFVVTSADQPRSTKKVDPDHKLYNKHSVVLTDSKYLSTDCKRSEIPQILLTNAHDGTSSFKLLGGFYRFICANGMVIGEDIHSIKLRHEFGVIFRQKIKDAIPEITSRLEEKVALVDQWKSIELPERDQIKLAESCTLIRFDGDKDKLKAFKGKDLVLPQRPEDAANDLWTVFNRIQERIINGGVEGVGANNQPLKMRAITSGERKIALNRAIWNEAAKLAA